MPTKDSNLRPTIAAIIPLYNGAKYIVQALESVLAQSLRADEIVVVDDGSTDDSPSIVRSMAENCPSITLLHKPNGGQSSARNFGVAHSKSDLIAFLDQDDYWYATHLEKLAEPFGETKEPPVAWVYSDLDEVDVAGGFVCRRLLSTCPGENPKEHLDICLMHNMHILPSASLISRDAFESVGGFDESLCGYEDDDLFLRLFRTGRQNVYIDEPLSVWRLYADSTARTKHMSDSMMIYVRKLIDEYPDNPATSHLYVTQNILPRFMGGLIDRYTGEIGGAANRETLKYHRENIESLLVHLPPWRRRKLGRLLNLSKSLEPFFKNRICRRLFLPLLFKARSGFIVKA